MTEWRIYVPMRDEPQLWEDYFEVNRGVACNDLDAENLLDWDGHIQREWL